MTPNRLGALPFEGYVETAVHFNRKKKLASQTCSLPKYNFFYYFVSDSKSPVPILIEILNYPVIINVVFLVEVILGYKFFIILSPFIVLHVAKTHVNKTIFLYTIV